MGTRAAFYVGNIAAGEAELLGCIAWDGYPDDSEVKHIADAKTESQFRDIVENKIAKVRDDWTPAEKGFPFPWTDDVFLTDCVYAFFDNAVWVDGSHRWLLMTDVLTKPDDYFQNLGPGNENFSGVHCGVRRSRSGEGKDSIMIVRAG